MPGIRIKLMMANLMKNKSRAEHYVPRDYYAVREYMDRINSKPPIPLTVEKRKDQIGSIPVVWFSDKRVDRKKIVYYIHGGGFNSGSAEFSHKIPLAICRRKGYPVVSAEYRLAPEHPYPAGLEDCIAVYRGLLEQGYEGEDIALIGDSAGGNLVFALTLYLRDHGIDLPAAVCGVSPVAVLDDSLPSRTERVDRDPMIGRDFTEEMQVTYVKDLDPRHPYLSPGYGDFTGFPPLWICVATEEVFYDDAFLLKKKAEDKGVPVEMVVGERLCHVYIHFPDKQSRQAIKDLRRFLRETLR